MRRGAAPLSTLAALLALGLAAPFAAGLLHLGTADWRGADLRGLLHATLVSTGTATASTLLVAVGGIPLGYRLARSDTPRMALVGILVQLPLALPPLSSGVLLLFLLGTGPIAWLTAHALTDSLAGIVLAEAFVSAPFLVIAARSAFAAIDPSFEEVAATLGHGPGAVFRRVSLAIGWRTILAGLLLAWLRAFGEFGATVLVAYHPTSLPVFTYVAFGSEGLPAMIPVLLPTLVVAVVVIALSQAALGGARRARQVETDRPLGVGAAVGAAAGVAVGAGGGAAPALSLELRRVLDGFSLDVGWRTQARRLAILGASGSGKSLTLRMIAGLDGAGLVRLGDRDLSRLPPEARAIGYVPQNYALLPHLTVGAQIRFAADADPARAALWSRRLGLDPLAGRLPAAISLGQQQRVALARALARPGSRLILLDEPFAALDTALRLRLRDELRALQTEIDVTTILVTHDPAEALSLADEILLLDEGRVLQSGLTDAVFARPADARAARLLGAVLIGDGIAVAPDRIDLGDDVHLVVAGPALAAGPVQWSARAAAFQLRRAGEGRYPATLLTAGPVEAGEQAVTLRLGACIFAFRTGPGVPAAGACGLDLDPAAIQVWFDPGLAAIQVWRVGRAGPYDPIKEEAT
jgi:molybdate transport system permease protein